MITGGAGAIGQATARAFLDEGASVFLLDLHQDAIDSALGDLASSNRPDDRAAGHAADVTSSTAVREAMAAAAATMSGVDTLINNAGLPARGALVDISEEEIDRQLAVNVKGVMLCAQAAIPIILESGGGSITSTSSQAGKRGWPKLSVYSAAKAAVLGFTRAMAVELAPEIRVNAICPGHIRDVGMAWQGFEQRLAKAQTVEAFGEAFAREYIPLQRLQGAEDIAAGFVYLSSPEAREITGAALNIGGGVAMD